MRLRLFGMVVAALGAFCIEASALAQYNTAVSTGDIPAGPFYLAPEVLGMFPSKSIVKDAPFVGARLGYQLDPNLALELESGWVGFEIRNGGEKLGQLNNVPLLVNARYGFLGAESMFDLFALGGLGVAFNDFSVDNELLSGKAKSGTFAAQVGGGISFSLTPDLMLTADARYYWNDPRVRVATRLDESEIISGISADSFVAGGSAIWKF